MHVNMENMHMPHKKGPGRDMNWQPHSAHATDIYCVVHTLEPCELVHWLMYQQPHAHAHQEQSSLLQKENTSF